MDGRCTRVLRPPRAQPVPVRPSCCSPVFVATLTSHSARSTRRARVRARAPAEDRRVPPDAPRGERKGCPLVSAEHSAAGESKDSSTE